MTNQLTHQDRIQALTDKIDELLYPQSMVVPAIDSSGTETYITKPILATDILRALGSNAYLRHDGTIFGWYGFGEVGDGSHKVLSTYITLNLALPLHSQSEQVVSDLYKLFFE